MLAKSLSPSLSFGVNKPFKHFCHLFSLWLRCHFINKYKVAICFKDYNFVPQETISPWPFAATIRLLYFRGLEDTIWHFQREVYERHVFVCFSNIRENRLPTSCLNRDRGCGGRAGKRQNIQVNNKLGRTHTHENTVSVVVRIMTNYNPFWHRIRMWKTHLPFRVCRNIVTEHILFQWRKSTLVRQ